MATNNDDLVLLLMWIPGLATLLVRLVLREGFEDVSFRLGGRTGLSALVAAYLLPLATLLAVFAVGWLSRLAPFDPPRSTVFPWANTSPLLQLAVAVGRGVPLVLIFNELLGAAGEEIGWRGYLPPRLIAAGVPHPLFISGIVWGLWHVPLVISGYVTGGSSMLTVPLFLLSTVALSYVLGILRLRSGSIWPPVLAHATINAALLVLGSKITPGFAHNMWVGEAGVLVTGGMLLLAALFVSRVDGNKRPPNEYNDR